MTDEVHVQAIGLRPERAEEDLRLHAEPWPEAIAALRATGLHDPLPGGRGPSRAAVPRGGPGSGGGAAHAVPRRADEALAGVDRFMSVAPARPGELGAAGRGLPAGLMR